MKRLVTSCTALAACVLTTSAIAATSQWETSRQQMTTSGSLAAYFDDAAAEDAAAEEEVATDEAEADVKQPGCGCEEPACGDEASCGCENGCGDECGNGCGSECASNGDLCSGWSLFDCCPGDPWLLQSYLQPCCDKSITYGGWFEMGYYNNNERLSFADNDGLSFRDFPDHLNLDQAWFYVEKLAEAEACSSDWGYRFDIMYGVDAQAAQAYGNPRALDGPDLGA